MTYQQKMQEEMTRATGQFRSQVEENKEMMFSKTTCGYCTTAKQTLAGLGTSYQSMEVNRMGRDGAMMMNAVKSETGQRTVPAIFICGRAVPGGGSGLERLVSSGELTGMLESCCRGDVTCSDYRRHGR
jgi:glutaredoxin 3